MRPYLLFLILTSCFATSVHSAPASNEPVPYFLRSPSPAPSPNKQSSTPTQVRIHYNPEREHYQKYNYIVLKEALDLTVADFGPYEFKVGNYTSVAKRQAVLLNTGDLINVHWAPPDSEIAQVNSIEIPVDFMFGLQGYRVCLVNSLNQTPLSKVKSLEDLQKIKIGQGDNWTEKDIYAKNKVPIYLSPTIESLFPPLGLNRFDCIALGINEVRDLYNNYITKFDFLGIDDNIMIHYDFPITFYVSKSSPELAARLTEGMKRLKESGKLQELFNKYHPNLAELKLENRKLICLKPLDDRKANVCEMSLPLKHTTEHLQDTRRSVTTK